MKKILSLAVLILALFVTACGSEETRNTPATDVHVLCRAFFYGDEESLKKIGMTPEEYDKQFIEEFSKSFTESSGLNFTPEQIAKVNDATRKLFARSTFGTADVSENGDNATVKITVSTLTMFTENDLVSKLPENIATLSEAERIDAIATAITELLQNMQYTGTTEFDVECKYDEQAKMWLPVDIKNFGNNIVMKILNVK